MHKSQFQRNEPVWLVLWSRVTYLSSSICTFTQVMYLCSLSTSALSRQGLRSAVVRPAGLGDPRRRGCGSVCPRPHGSSLPGCLRAELHRTRHGLRGLRRHQSGALRCHRWTGSDSIHFHWPGKLRPRHAPRRHDDSDAERTDECVTALRPRPQQVS